MGSKLSLWVMIASQRQYSLDFSEKFKIYSMFKRISSLSKIILVNYFQVNGRSLVYSIMEKKYVEWKLSLWVMIASQIQYSLDFSEEFKIPSILKIITSLIQNKFSKLFSGKWTVLSINIMEKNMWNGN